MNQVSEHIKGAITLIVCDGVMLLQRRDDKPGVLFPGYIGLWGGAAEGSEDPLETAVRELREETDLVFEPSDLRHIATLEMTSHHRNDQADSRLTQNLYLLEISPDQREFAVHEGSGSVPIAIDADLHDYQIVPSHFSMLNAHMGWHGGRY